MTNTVSIEAFEGEYLQKYIGGAEDWNPCTVVGVIYGSTPKFVILIEDADGSMWVSDAETVRRV